MTRRVRACCHSFSAASFLVTRYGHWAVLIADATGYVITNTLLFTGAVLYVIEQWVYYVIRVCWRWRCQTSS